MSDLKILLEKASRKVGFTGELRIEMDRLFAKGSDGRWNEWNPIDDGDDALNLAVDAGVLTQHYARLHQIYINYLEEGSEPREAMRLAIVQTVAEIPEGED